MGQRHDTPKDSEKEKFNSFLANPSAISRMLGQGFASGPDRNQHSAAEIDYLNRVTAETISARTGTEVRIRQPFVMKFDGYDVHSQAAKVVGVLSNLQPGSIELSNLSQILTAIGEQLSGMAWRLSANPRYLHSHVSKGQSRLSPINHGHGLS